MSALDYSPSKLFFLFTPGKVFFTVTDVFIATLPESCEHISSSLWMCLGIILNIVFDFFCITVKKMEKGVSIQLVVWVRFCSTKANSLFGNWQFCCDVAAVKLFFGAAQSVPVRTQKGWGADMMACAVAVPSCLLPSPEGCFWPQSRCGWSGPKEQQFSVWGAMNFSLCLPYYRGLNMKYITLYIQWYKIYHLIRSDLGLVHYIRNKEKSCNYWRNIFFKHLLHISSCHMLI